MTSVPYGAAFGAVAALTLGGAYLAGGLSSDAAVRDQADRFAVAAAQGFSEDAIAEIASAGDPAGLALNKGPTATVSVADAMSALRGPGAQPAKATGAASQARELECLTEAVYYEARGETPAGQQAVAQVVLNRVHHPAFPKSVCGVVHQGCQFSFACDGSLRRAKERGAWDRARRIATRALSGQIFADVGQATHFHVNSVQPGWNMLRVAQIGTHVFYRFGRPLGSSASAQADIPPKAEQIAASPAEPPQAAPQVILASVTTPVPVKAEAPQVISMPAAKPEAAKAETPKAEPAASKPAL